MIDKKEKKFLTCEQLREIEKGLNEQKILNIRIENEKKLSDIFRLKFSLFEKEKQLAAVSLKNHEKDIKELEEKLNKKKENHASFLKEISDKIGIKGAFGFNPDTGEIIKGEEK
jgi:hypothetical protein